MPWCPSALVACGQASIASCTELLQMERNNMGEARVQAAVLQCKLLRHDILHQAANCSPSASSNTPFSAQSAKTPAAAAASSRSRECRCASIFSLVAALTTLSAVERCIVHYNRSAYSHGTPCRTRGPDSRSRVSSAAQGHLQATCPMSVQAGTFCAIQCVAKTYLCHRRAAAPVRA